MSDELTAVKESITEIMLDLMTERVMWERGVSIGVQASSTRGLETSPSMLETDQPDRPMRSILNTEKYREFQANSEHSTCLPSPSKWCHQPR
jgi:hypothetical protein